MCEGWPQGQIEGVRETPSITPREHPMTDHLTRTSAQQHVADLVSGARQARVSRDLRRARRRFNKARRQANGATFEVGVMTTEPLTGVRWGHRLGPAAAQ